MLDSTISGKSLIQMRDLELNPAVPLLNFTPSEKFPLDHNPLITLLEIVMKPGMKFALKANVKQI